MPRPPSCAHPPRDLSGAPSPQKRSASSLPPPWAPILLPALVLPGTASGLALLTPRHLKTQPTPGVVHRLTGRQRLHDPGLVRNADPRVSPSRTEAETLRVWLRVSQTSSLPPRRPGFLPFTGRNVRCIPAYIVLGPQGTRPGVRGLCEGQQGRRAHGTVFPGVGAIAVWLLADVGLQQSRHNCIHFGDTAWRSQWFGGSWHNGWYRSVSLIN